MFPTIIYDRLEFTKMDNYYQYHSLLPSVFQVCRICIGSALASEHLCMCVGLDSHRSPSLSAVTNCLRCLRPVDTAADGTDIHRVCVCSLVSTVVNCFKCLPVCLVFIGSSLAGEHLCMCAGFVSHRSPSQSTGNNCLRCLRSVDARRWYRHPSSMCLQSSVHCR